MANYDQRIIKGLAMGAMRHFHPKRAGLRVSSYVVSLVVAAMTFVALHGSTVVAQTSASLPASSAHVSVKNLSAKPISGWTSFCERMPGECLVNTSEPDSIRLTPEVWRTIVRVNQKVNRSIKAQTDRDHWGVEDRWDFAEDGYGDCEDYQLVKRRVLVEAGLPRRALRMTVVIDEEGQGHAVMMVRTDRGDFILDNKRNAVLPWNRTGYTYVKQEGSDGAAWASLGGAVASPVATAGR